MHVVAHGSRHADPTGGAFSLKPRCDIHGIAMQIGAIGNGIAKVDPYAEPDSPVWRLVGIQGWNPLLHLHCTTYRPIYAVKYDQ